MKTKLSEVRYGSKKDTTRLTAAKKMTSVRKGRKENKLVQLVQKRKKIPMSIITMTRKMKTKKLRKKVPQRSTHQRQLRKRKKK